MSVTHPDWFAAALPASPPVTQGAWTGLDFEGCDEMQFDEYTPCYIQANDGDARAQHHRRLLENLRHVPIAIYHGAADELVPSSGVTRQAERLVELGYRHRLYLFLTQEHYGPPVWDQWGEGARYMHQFTQPGAPGARSRTCATCRSSARPSASTAAACARLRLRQQPLAEARSSRPTPRTAARRSTARRWPSRRPAAHACPRRAARRRTDQAGPYAMTGLRWQDGPARRRCPTARNAFDGRRSPAPARATLDAAGMGLDTRVPVTGTITTDTPLDADAAGAARRRRTTVDLPAPATHEVTCRRARARIAASPSRARRARARGRAGAARRAAETQHGSTYARVSATEIVLGNALVERRLARAALRTTALVDKRGLDAVRRRRARDFALGIGARHGRLGALPRRRGSTSTDLPRGGLRLTMTPRRGAGPRGRARRRGLPGIAGFRRRRSSSRPPRWRSASVVLESCGRRGHAGAARASAPAPTGATPSGPGPSSRSATRTPARGARRKTAAPTVDGPGQWLSVGDGGRARLHGRRGHRLPVLARQLRRARPRAARRLRPGRRSCSARSRRAATSRTRPARRPAPAGRPARADARARRVVHRRRRGDGDDDVAVRQVPARAAAALRARPRSSSTPTAPTPTASRTGAKDDMDTRDGPRAWRRSRAAPRRRHVRARRRLAGALGRLVPRLARVPRAARHRRRASRTPTFTAVREAIAPMKLGLWMSPMHFHPASETCSEHPRVGVPAGRRGARRLQRGRRRAAARTRRASCRGARPRSRYIEARIRQAITEWGVTYFKFDFLAWLDCAGQGDFYAFRDAFVAMLDRLRADHPAVTLQIDETNDYRLFPFASTTPRADVVPERPPRARPAAAQPLEPQPVRADLRARPARPRRRAWKRPPGRHAHGGGAAVAHLVLHRHPHAARRRSSPRRRRGSRSTGRTASCSPAA